MLYVSAGAFEQCAADKHKIHVVCPSIWIHYVISGRGYYNGREISANEAFIVYKNDVCEYYPDKNDPWAYVWVRIEGSDPEDILNRCALPPVSGVFNFDYGERLVAVIKNTASDEFLSNENMLYKESLAKMILSLNLGDPRRSAGRESEWVTRAKEYIGANYHKRLTVEQLAEAIHVDRRYLRNLFVKHTGKSTKAYLDELRMERSAELLVFSELSVGIIATSVGYDDQLSFSKAFKKHFKVSPTEYRQRNVGKI